MENPILEMLIGEIRENRKEIRLMRRDIADLDKHVFSNKLKLSLFIGTITLFFSTGYAILFEKLKQHL